MYARLTQRTVNGKRQFRRLSIYFPLAQQIAVRPFVILTSVLLKVSLP